MMAPPEVWFSELLIESYQRIVGAPLVPDGLGGADAARWLYESPVCLLAQDTSPDPCFVYANAAAQKCFEYSWDEFVGMPSRLSAEVANQQERQEFLNSVLEVGFARGYRGARIAKSGRRFWVEDVTVWNLVDTGGTLHGQAARVPRCVDA
ncbi:MAG TPA: MEKHLA domain-containing protein [Streptosporangiaceae bacterium]|nr:MEKHLA domain-containing protein [Streptosporangiaceae bacterium]